MTIHITGQYFLNHLLTPDELKTQVKMLAAAGYESIYGHARQGLKTPYLSEAWWEAIRIIVEECRANGMRFAIWDEDYFPSGVAGNRIIWNHPELAAQALEFTVTEVSANTKSVELLLKDAALLKCYALPKENNGFGSPIDLTAYCGTMRSCWDKRRITEGTYSHSCKVGTPHWRTTINHKTFALLWEPEDKREYTIVAAQIVHPKGRHNTDLLNPETTRKFIEYTHQEYLKRFSDEILRNDFHASFMDEPAPAGLFPWTGGFDQKFVQNHGFSLIEYLPHLILDIDDRTPFIRHKYRTTQARLQCENYLAQIQNWCRKHSIKSVGHLTRTEYLSYVCHAWPNELRCCKYLDIPCSDPLGSGIAWSDACSYHTGLKVASSAAHIFGKEQAGSDALAVMGNETSLRDLKFALDFQMIMGINYFNIHGLNYSLDGPRKDETPPSLFYQHTEWKYMQTLIEHTKNTCQTLTGGKHICSTAVLYPAASFYCAINQHSCGERDPLEDKIHHLSEVLLSHQKDFDFIDETTLAEMNNSGFPEDWRVIILPHLSYIEQHTAHCLAEFAANGGKIIVLGQYPELLGDSISNPLSTWSEDNVLFSETMTEQLLSELPGVELKGNGSCDIFVLQREKDGEIISFLVNRAEQEFRGYVEGKELHIPPKGSVLLSSKCNSAPQAPAKKEPVFISGNWRVEFEPNHIPLCIWTISNINGDTRECNLMERQEEPPETLTEDKIYKSRFLLTGGQMPLKLVLEESSIGGNWKIFVNNLEIKEFRKEQVYDCLNMVANIGHALRGGTTPSENIISVETQGKENGLFEIPYLYGNFTCEYRHAYRSLPFLQSGGGIIETDVLLPWKELGYPTLSGSAEYSIDLNIPASGEYWLDLGRVEDIADIFIDKKPVKLLPWPPYECNIGFLSAGSHTLTVKVSNGPGNRDRLAMLTAGLLGPVRLFRL